MSEVVEKQRSGKSLTFWIRLLVAGGIVGFIVVNNDWGLFWKELSRARWEWLLAAFVSFGVCLLAGSWRWQQLLRVQSIRLPLSQTWLITMIGFFFNQFLIGSTGGDLVKGFYAIRQAPERKAKAALSIVMDRVMGLVAILAGRASIRDVIAFPKTQKGQDLMAEAPGPVADKQLRDRHIALLDRSK